MKIICIGRNYREHARELNNPLPQSPVFFLKPDSAILKNGKPFFLPGFSSEVHHEIELVIKINRLGKGIPEKYSHRYYQEVSLGIDFTARDLQQVCKERGLPWEIAKAFDGSAAIGTFIPLDGPGAVRKLIFRLDINGRTVQEGNTADMIFPVDHLISYVSGFITIRTGDLLFTGTPRGVGPVRKGDHLEGFLHDQKLLDFYIR